MDFCNSISWNCSFKNRKSSESYRKNVLMFSELAFLSWAKVMTRVLLETVRLRPENTSIKCIKIYQWETVTLLSFKQVKKRQDLSMSYWNSKCNEKRDKICRQESDIIKLNISKKETRFVDKRVTLLNFK